MKSESSLAVYGALFGNLAVAITKFIAAAVTGSSAMLSEGIHSSVDTGDQLLLLIGMRRSRLPPDAEHPFGHGKELYFWSLIVAVLIFGVGGGISAYEGILHMLTPAPLEEATWSYVVLACAFVFESVSLGIALRAFWREKGEKGFWSHLRHSKNPAVYTVLAEDSAALAGIVIAFAGVYSSHVLELPVLDGLASLLIGLLLAGVAVLLIWQSRGLLVGEGVDPETAREIRAIVSGMETVEVVARPLTMYFGPDNVLLTLDVRFTPRITAAEVARTIDRIESRIRARFPYIKRIYIEARALESAVAAGAA